jgi:MFS family permease
LKKLRGQSNNEQILEELEELSAEKALRSSQNLIRFNDLFTKPTLRRPLLLTIVIQASQQFSGINSVRLTSKDQKNNMMNLIFYTIKIAIYSTNMFISIGLDEHTWAIYATILIDIFKVSITLVCMILIDIAGRRSLLLVGLIGMSLFSFCLALVPAIFDGQQWSKYLTVVSAVTYVIFFSIGPGSIPWLITAELFGSDSRGKATSIAVFTNWLSNFIVTTSIPLITDRIENYIYIMFGIFIIFSVIFIYYKVPETKKKSIDEISKYFVD